MPTHKKPTHGHSTSIELPEHLDQHSRKVILEYFQSAFRLDENKILERPIFGTTLYIASCKLELAFGTFTVHTFQDIIHKGYVLALTYGDLEKASEIYCRVHSSCVTGETLRGCDCDCAQQLDGALQAIVTKGHGILFYLMQEGRGVGYLAKSRDRMLVQACEDRLSTFQAYQLLGLQRDYRHYEDISSILKLLRLQPKLVLFTNNPEKVKALKDLGIQVLRTEPLELPPTPFNLKYLTSKMEAGHTLQEPEKSIILPMYPSAPVLPFKPHALKDAMRFVYVASYFLPIRPIRGHVVLSLAQYEKLIAKRSIENLMNGEKPLVRSHTRLRGDRFLIYIHKKNFLEHQAEHPNDVISMMLSQPHWFRVHVYSDTVTSEDCVLLTYGQIHSYDTPVVRLHSESVFSRFPLKDDADRTKFNAAIEQIVNYGCGILVLLYNDGRGAGFGAYAQDVMLQQRGLSHSTQQSYQMLGVPYDRRDYDAAITLLKHHLPHPRIQMAVNAPNSIINKPESAQALNDHGIQVENWIFLRGEANNDEKK